MSELVAIDVTAAVGENISGVGYHIVSLVDGLRRCPDAPDLVLLFECHGAGDWRRARQRFPSGPSVRLVPIPFLDTRFATVRKIYRSLLLPLALRLSGARLLHGPAHIIPEVRVPTVVSIHDLAFFRHDIYSGEFLKSLRNAVASSTNRATAVIALSQYTRQEIGALLGRQHGVHVVYGAGKTATEFERQPKPADRVVLSGLGIPGRYILYVGDFGPRKNLPFLIDSFSVLRRSNPALDCHLVLVGNSSEARETLMTQATSLGIADRVLFTGRVSEAVLAVLYRNAAVFALCSLMEGFTLVTIEAMSYGVPVVATRTSSIAEGTGDAAELVPLGDAAAVAGALERVLTDGTRRAEMKALGLQRAACFSWDRAALETVSLYRQLLGSRR